MKIGEHEVKISKVTWGDVEDLEEKGVSPLDGEKMSAKQTRIFAQHMATKSNPSITEEDMRALAPNEILEIVNSAWGVNEDFLSPSLSSPKSGDGESRKSKH